MAAADADDATLREFIAVLDAHRKECERECKYVEADIAKRRLAELRALAESREVDTVASRQHAQRQGVEEAQMLEFQQFNTLWDKFREYDERAAELLDAMRQRHLLDQEEFRKSVEAGPAHRPKASKELLDLRRKQVMVAKQGDYADAQKLKTRRRARGGGGGAPRARGRAARAARRGEVHAAPGAGAQRAAQADPDGRRGAAPRASSTSSSCSSGTRTSRAGSRRSRPPSATGREGAAGRASSGRVWARPSSRAAAPPARSRAAPRAPARRDAGEQGARLSAARTRRRRGGDERT